MRRSAGVCETQVKISIVSSQRERPAHRCAAAIIARAASSASAAESMSSYDTRRGGPSVDVASCVGCVASCVAVNSRVAFAFCSVPRHGFERPQMFRREAEPTADLTASQHPAALQPQHAVPLRHVRHRRVHQVHLRRFDKGDYPRGRSRNPESAGRAACTRAGTAAGKGAR